MPVSQSGNLLFRSSKEILPVVGSATPNNDTQDVSGYYTSLYQEYVECRSSGTIESPRYPMPIDADDFCVVIIFKTHLISGIIFVLDYPRIACRLCYSYL